MKKVGSLVLGKDQLFVSVELIDRLYLHGQERKQDFDGRHIFQADAFAAYRKLLDWYIQK